MWDSYENFDRNSDNYITEGFSIEISLPGFHRTLDYKIGLNFYSGLLFILKVIINSVRLMVYV